MFAKWIIEKKRDGQALSEDEIRFIIQGYTRGDIPDYQLSALAMAIFFRGLNVDELSVLTDAMMRSGVVLDLSPLGLPTVDKHSTGGLGDKVSMVLAPLVACCGIAVPMIAGRGLGITGGTIDKLESIPGYRTGLSSAEFLAVLKQCGCSIIGQTGELAPADRKLYALRDVSGTVPSIPMIAASIMSKKLAEGAQGLVLDVKWGKGAFMKTRQAAGELARTLVDIGRRMNRGMAALITDMNQPLGRTVGNALEIREAVETLQGRGPSDLEEVTLALAAEMLRLGGKAGTAAEATPLLRRHLDSGAAFRRFVQMVGLHGGDPRALTDPSGLPAAPRVEAVAAPSAGFVAGVDADLIGQACLLLGAGRATTDDTLDYAAGISGLLKIGDPVKRGAVLASVHANNNDKLIEALPLIREAFTLSPSPVKPPPLIAERIG